MKIFLAAAHGGNDPGAVANNTTEAEEAKKIVEKCAGYLKKYLRPGEILMIVPHNLALEAEVEYINRQSNRNPGDICIEVNMNSNQGTPGTGIETYYGQSSLADILQKPLVKITKLADRGVKDGSRFYFNNMTSPGSALVELGFINNTNDLAIVREKGAYALAKGIADYLGLIMPDEPPNENPPSVSPVPPTTNLKTVVIRGKIERVQILGENLLIN